MVITEKENTTASKPKKKKWGKIILIVLGVWLGLGLVSGLMLKLLEDEESENKITVTNTNAISGFANIKFGAKKDTVLQDMKNTGWVQSGSVNYMNLSGVNTEQYTFVKNRYFFAGHEVLGVTLNFEEESGIFWMYSVSFDFENTDSGKYSEFVKDCTSISDFTPIQGSVSSSGEKDSVLQNSNGDMCVIDFVEHDALVFSYFWADAIAR